MDLASLRTRDNVDDSRFELELEGAVARIDYKKGKSGVIYLIHTEVPDQFEGEGVGHKLVREALEIIETNKLTIIPLCPFVRAFLKKHRSDYEQLLAEGAKL